MNDTVTTTQIEASLSDLLKATNATNIAKGGIENSGTYSDGKPSGGGQGSMSDSGTVDDLMIAKMTAAGIDAGTIASFQAFMSKEDDEDEDEDEMEGGMSGKKPPQPPFTQKSMTAFREDEDIAKAIDVSPFLEALVARTADQFDGIRKSHGQVAAQQGSVNKKLAAALFQIGSLIKSQSEIIDALNTRLKLVERTPVASPKGATSSARALTKSMPGEAGGPDPLRLSKSELLSTLSYMNLEKGIRSINGQPTYEVISLFNGGNVLDAGVIEQAERFLRENPNEASQARSYR